MEKRVEIISSFVLGFVVMWFASRILFIKPNNSTKQTMIEIAHTYCNNKKICKEIKDYSISQIKNGNYEYIEVIDTLKRNNNDKTRT